MKGKEKLSQTMRIDLIPDVPVEPVSGKEKRVVISSPTRRFKAVPVQGSKAEETPAELKYQELLQSVYDGALISNLSGQIVDTNVRAQEFFQYARSEFAGLTVFDVISGVDEELIKTLCDNLENERYTLIQAYCLRKDGSYFPAEIAVNKLRAQEMQLCFFVRDITIRRQAEEMLRTEHNAIQNAGNGIAVADLEARLEYVNPAVEKMWKYEGSDQLLGADIRGLFVEGAKVDEMIKEVLDGKGTWSGEISAKSKDGGEFQIQVSAACNKNTDGEPIGMVFSFVDISDRKRAQEAEREAERNRVMFESLGAACHHLGQPATVLLANLGIIQKRLQTDDDMVKELIKTSLDASETMGEILHRLNTVNEYKTTQYLEKMEGSDSPENRILQI